MSFNDILIGIGIGVVTTVITTGVTFYVKDFLQERAKFKKFKTRLEQYAGKNAQIMIPLPYVGQVKINRIDKEGIEVENQLSKTFIPIDKVFQTEISLPSENYDKLAKDLMVKTAKESFDLIFPLLTDKLKELFVKEFLEEGTELNAVVALQVKSQIKDQGEKTPSIKQIIDYYEKQGKSGKKENPKPDMNKEDKNLESAQQQKTN